MSRAIKFKNNDYIDTSGIIHKGSNEVRSLLKDDLDNKETQINYAVERSNYAVAQLNSKVDRTFLGNSVNIDNYHYVSGIHGIYGASNPVNSQIAVLEVLHYSDDWVIQRITSVQTGSMWQRTFTGGNTWSGWVQRW